MNPLATLSARDQGSSVVFRGPPKKLVGRLVWTVFLQRFLLAVVTIAACVGISDLESVVQCASHVTREEPSPASPAFVSGSRGMSRAVPVERTIFDVDVEAVESDVDHEADPEWALLASPAHSGVVAYLSPLPPNRRTEHEEDRRAHDRLGLPRGPPV